MTRDELRSSILNRITAYSPDQVDAAIDTLIGERFNVDAKGHLSFNSRALETALRSATLDRMTGMFRRNR